MMKNKRDEHLIALDEFCVYYKIEQGFVWSLHEAGLVRIETIEDCNYVEEENLSALEKFIRFYYDMDINIEGIEAINHLLEQMDEMQHELISLKNRLRFYEGG
ncbi:MAG: chaperone modulator CbpM [Lentimicrobium sp.]|nr:chaperone modulator CbpM [Lentimicrobium sp.]